MGKLTTLTILSITLSLTACTVPNYSKRDRPSARIADVASKYGSTAVAGAAGYYAADKATGNKSTAAGVGILSGGLMWMFNNRGEKKAEKAYDTGVVDGANSVRAEILNEKWRREATLGVKDEEIAQGPYQGNTRFRRVYVPSREINGVKYDGGYQAVPYSR